MADEVTSSPVPEQTSQNAGIMDTNFGRPSLDQIAEKLNSGDLTPEPKQDFSQGGTPPVEEKPEHEPPPESKNSVDDFMERERELFREKQQLKLEREALEASKQEKKDYLNASDEDLDAMIDKIISGGSEEDPEAETEKKNLSPDEMREQIKKELMDDLKAEKEQEAEVKFIDDYKKSIIEEVADKEEFAMTSAFGQSDMVYDVIEQDFIKKSELYGEAYARENMLSIKDSAQLVEKHLATEMQNALKLDTSGHLKNVLLGFLGENPNQNQSSQDQLSQTTTITPDITQTTNTPINEALLTEEQRMARALAKL